MPDRSLELAAAYDKAKDAQDKATLAASENIQTKKEIAKEYRAYKEHKTEAAKLTKLKQERVRHSPRLPMNRFSVWARH